MSESCGADGLPIVVVEAHLPFTQKAADVDIEVRQEASSWYIQLHLLNSTQSDGKINPAGPTLCDEMQMLRACLPGPVDEGLAKAKFDKKRRHLTISFPRLP